jgi:asparagine synthase (glutamine-hydrolysing)
MCGIAGFIYKENDDHQDLPILSNMLDSIKHRGPDGSGMKIFNQDVFTVGLGHRRLAILDTGVGGHQPMSFESLSISYNGEIYNFKEIKTNLEKLGYEFNSSSDTEVVLKAYHKWGTKCFDKFNGMWAIAIYDKLKNLLILCRDRSGVKPLYYYLKENNFIFGSELKIFHQSPLFEKEIDEIGMSLYFQYGYIKEPFTIFKNTFKLDAGHLLTVQLDNKIEVKKYKYWDITDFYLKPKIKTDTQEALKEVERLMVKGCNYRMISDVPVGVFLSGGIDSSLVTAMLQSTSTNKIKTFTIGFEDPKYDEAPFAKRIAKYLGTDHNELYFGVNEIQNALDGLPEVIDEPFADSSIIPTLILSKFTRQHVTVALSADGGDELFGGYERFIDSYNRTNQLKMIGKFPAKVASSVLCNLFPLLKRAGNQYYKLLELTSHSESYLKNYQVFNKYVYDKQMEFFYGLDPVNINGNTSNFKSPYDEMLCWTFKTFLNNDVLQKVDKASMAFGLEGREPLLDVNLVEFVAQLPASIKINKNELKWGLKEILYKHVPKELYTDKKMGFTIPSAQLSKHVEERFDHSLLRKLISNGLFRPEVANKDFLDKDFRRKWQIFIFLTWYAKWMKL